MIDAIFCYTWYQNNMALVTSWADLALFGNGGPRFYLGVHKMGVVNRGASAMVLTKTRRGEVIQKVGPDHLDPPSRSAYGWFHYG
jgi:hypothetical protein